MKKIFALILALVMVFSLAACGGDNNTIAGGDTTPTHNIAGTANTPTEGSQGTPSTTEPPATTPPATEPGHTHNYATTVTAPTCTNEGYTTYKCSCGDSIVSNKTQSVGHKFSDWQTTKQPTTAETGVAERKCANCTAKETKTLGKVVTNHTHSYTSKITQTASCTKAGIKTFSCACGESYTEKINASGHSWGNWATEVAAEVGKAGLEMRSCSTCKTPETRLIPALQEDTTKTWFVNEYNKAKQQYINSLSSSVASKNSEIATLREQASSCYVAYVNETKRIKNQCANMGMSNSGYGAGLLKNAEENYNAQARIYTNKIQQLENEINTAEAEKANPSVDSILEIVAKNNNISSIETYEYYNKYSASIS